MATAISTAAAAASLSAAGGSIYNSNTLHVGDGTWDSGRDTFLLPNLVGLNFATMQYNGMGNRFLNLPEYHVLIAGHAAMAAIVFLLLVPSAIAFAKFGLFTSAAWNVRFHVYCHILTILLLTVALVLGWMAVGPQRSLTNPHHGIGVALYTLVWAQFLYGWLMSRIEQRRKNPQALIRTPTKVWLHKLLGRSIALLGIVQIALGLTLYGSPKILFILFALWAAFLFSAYLILDRVYFEKRPVMFGIDGGRSDYQSDYGSYFSDQRTELTQDQRPRPERERTHWGRDALGVVGALGLYEAFNRRRSDRREGREQAELNAEGRNRPPPPGGYPPGPPGGYPPPGPGGYPPPEPGGYPPPGPGGFPPPGRANYGPPGPGILGLPQPGGYPGAPPGGFPPQSTGRPLIEGAMLAGSEPPRRPLGPPPGRPGIMRTPTGRPPRIDDDRMTPESMEDEKYNQPPRRNTWRDRILGAGAGIAAFEGARRLFAGRRRDEEEDDYVDSRYNRPPLGGNQNMVDQVDVSRVEAGQAPFSPNGTPRRRDERVNIAGVAPDTPGATPSRPPRRPRHEADSMSYDDEESYAAGPGDGMVRRDEETHTLRNSIATLGAIAGFREWSNHRRDRRERQRLDRIRRDELENEEMYNRRNSMNYPRPQDAGRRPSMDGTVMTGITGQEPGFVESIHEVERRDNNIRPPVDTLNPPLPAGAFQHSVSGAGAAPSTVGPSISRQNLTQEQQQGYSIPPPPFGPPPAGPSNTYRGAETGTLQMPQGAVQPDPNRLLSSENVSTRLDEHDHPIRDAAAAGLAGAAVGAVVADRHRRVRSNSQSESPSRPQESRNRLRRPDRAAGSTTEGSMSQTVANGSNSNSNNNPAVSLNIKPHADGKYVTLRRLSEQEEADRAARKQERKIRRRRGSRVSSGEEDDGGAGASDPRRYRRGNSASGGSGAGARSNMRPSSQQPFVNVPPPPALSSAAASSSAAAQRRDEELNLPPPSGLGSRLPQASSGSLLSPGQQGHGLSPPPGAAGVGSGLSGGFGSPGDAGTGTDVSTFADNARRRRAERARRTAAAAARGKGVQFAATAGGEE